MRRRLSPPRALNPGSHQREIWRSCSTLPTTAEEGGKGGEVKKWDIRGMTWSKEIPKIKMINKLNEKQPQENTSGSKIWVYLLNDSVHQRSLRQPMSPTKTETKKTHVMSLVYPHIKEVITVVSNKRERKNRPYKKLAFHHRPKFLNYSFSIFI